MLKPQLITTASRLSIAHGNVDLLMCCPSRFRLAWTTKSRRKANAQIPMDFGDCILEQKQELLRLLDAWLELSPKRGLYRLLNGLLCCHLRRQSHDQS